MDAAAPNAATSECRPDTQPASPYDMTGLSPRARFLTLVGLAIAPWALAFGVAMLLH